MIRLTLFILIIFISTACQKEPKKQRYTDSKIMNLTSIRWGKDDFLELSKRMVQSILKSKNIDLSNTKVYAFKNIRNDSHDHIDTNMLQNEILLALSKSNKFTFTKNTKSKEDYLFHGKISSIFKKNTNIKDMFFSFNLTLVNAKTATIIYSEDIEIRKIYKKPLLAW